MANSKLTKDTIYGVNWSFLRSIGQNFFKFIVSTVLARLLAPEAFGLLSIATIFIGLGNIFSTLGIGPAVIQKKELSETNIRVGTTLAVLSSAVIYGLIWFSAPFVSLFFNEPQVTLILRVIGIIFPLQGIASVSRGLLKRDFKFKSLTFIEIGSYLFGYGMVAITLAILNFGVWSLVYGVLCRNTFLTIALLIKVKVPFHKPMLRDGEAKRMMFFGGGISGIQLFNYIATKLDYFIIGRYMSASQLGLYTKAYSLMMLPSNLFSDVLGNVLLSSFSDVQDNIERMRRGFLKSVQMSTIIGIPLLSGMAVCSDYLIVGLYGDQWAEASTPFAILCLAAIFKLTFRATGSVVQALGHVYKELKRQGIYAVLLAIGIWIGISFGLIGVSWAVVIASAIFCGLMTQISLKLLKCSWLDFLIAYKGGVILSLPVILFDLTSIYVIENMVSDLPTEIKLVILIVISGFSLLGGFLFIPQKVKGTAPQWLLDTYGEYLPTKYENIVNRTMN